MVVRTGYVHGMTGSSLLLRSMKACLSRKNAMRRQCITEWRELIVVDTMGTLKARDKEMDGWIDGQKDG